MWIVENYWMQLSKAGISTKNTDYKNIDYCNIYFLPELLCFRDASEILGDFMMLFELWSFREVWKLSSATAASCHLMLSLWYMPVFSSMNSDDFWWSCINIQWIMLLSQIPDETILKYFKYQILYLVSNYQNSNIYCSFFSSHWPCNLPRSNIIVLCHNFSFVTTAGKGIEVHCCSLIKWHKK